MRLGLRESPWDLSLVLHCVAALQPTSDWGPAGRFVGTVSEFRFFVLLGKDSKVRFGVRLSELDGVDITECNESCLVPHSMVLRR